MAVWPITVRPHPARPGRSRRHRPGCVGAGRGADHAGCRILDTEGQAAYDFYFDGTADWQWTAEETRHAPASTTVLHFGSIASWTSPGRPT